MTATLGPMTIVRASERERRVLALELLREQLGYVYAHTAMYRRKFDEAGVSPADITSLDDLARLPLTTKAELRDSQRREPPFGDYLGVDLTDVVRAHSTSGTTGEPVWEALTRADIDDIELTSAVTLHSMGLRPEDVVVPMMNYCLFMGGFTDSCCLERLGATMIPVGIGNTDSLLGVLQRIRSAGRDIALFSTPSYATYLAEAARRAGLEPRSLGLRKGMFGGEYGASDPAFRKKIQDDWGFTTISDMSGASEVHPLMFGSCQATDGLHFLTPTSVYVELIDPETAAPVEMRPGARGELCVTHLRRRAQPLVRYRLKDVAEVLSAPGEECSCGATTFRFRYRGRSDDMLVIQGVNVYPDGIWRVLLDRRPDTTGEYQIVLDAPPPFEDPIRLRIEHGHQFTGDPGELADSVRRQLREQFYFTARVEVVPAGALPRTERKAKRIYRVYEGEVVPDVA